MMNSTTDTLFPVLFLAHGHPLNAIEDNEFTKHLVGLGKLLPKPDAILIISAHWQTVGTYISTNQKPLTIYDFGNFHPDLFKIKYQAPGARSIAESIIESFPNLTLKPHPTMGFDHGAWTILKFLFPNADIPAFQLSLDYSLNLHQHYDLAKNFISLRSKKILIIGSGNIVHNLYKLNWSNKLIPPFQWAIDFDLSVEKLLNEKNHTDLINYQKICKNAEIAVPSVEHYLPMLYAIANQTDTDKLEYTYKGFEYGSLSMRSFIIK